MSNTNIIEIIDKYGLEFSTLKENMSLFTVSCVAFGYADLLKKNLGFSYEAVGMFGIKNLVYYMFNDAHIAEKTEEFLSNNLKHIKKKFFSPAQKILKQTQKQIEKIKTKVYSQPDYCLKIIRNIYPTYFYSIALYNCFFRYERVTGKLPKISPDLLNRLKKGREATAELYPKVEKVIETAVKSIGKNKKLNFDSKLLKYLSLREMDVYLAKKRISKAKVEELIKRRKGYFYLYIGNKKQEYILTDKKSLGVIYDKFLKIKENGETELIQGRSVYPGKIRGIVYKSIGRIKMLERKFVLVASMTHPKDIALIKKSSAIVTDEGGILSHAAIISRELQKPCVIGTKIATKVLKDGDKVEVDANKGIVRKLK